MGQDGSCEGATTNKLPTLDEVARWVLQQPTPARSMSELLGLASVGTVLHAWRNSPLEDAHAAGWSPLTDGEMMRTNAATTRLVREYFAEFFAGVLDVDVPAPADEADTAVYVTDKEALAWEAIDEFYDADVLVEYVLAPLHQALLRRVLPCGYTVAEATREHFDDLDEHIALDLDSFAHLTENHSLRAALFLKAAVGKSQNWWLTPEWPESVDAIRTFLADPNHHHWRIGGYPDVSDRPDRCANIDHLAVVLREGPDRLTAAEAKWCVHKAAIGFAQHSRRGTTTSDQ